METATQPTENSTTEKSIGAGDIVQLRSGGPRMTVLEVHPKKETAKCIWMDATGRLREHNFPSIVLTANVKETAQYMG